MQSPDTEIPRPKYTARVTVAITPQQKRQLDLLAIEERLEPGQKARNIVLDFLEGKLVKASLNGNGGTA